MKSKDKPIPKSISPYHLAAVIGDGLSYDRSVKIDRAVRDILAKTTEDEVAMACVVRLLGRGYDADIDAYYRRREKVLDDNVKRFFNEVALPKAGWSPVHVAIWRGQQERMTELLREGTKVNARTKDGRTPLHVAAAERNAQAVKLLLAAGADLKATDAQGRTPVSVASFEGNWDLARQLLEAGSPISDILTAATLGKTEAVADFLHKDKETRRVKDRAGLTPLHRAAAEGHVKVIQLLLAAGAEVDAQNEDGWTPLHLAAAFGRANACELLIQHKAKIDRPLAESHEQPIHLAAIYGRPDVVKLLIEKGAKVDARDAHDAIPLHKAAEQGHLAVVQWLVEHKADINAIDDRGETAISLATKSGHKEVVTFLLKNGAKKSPRD